MGKQIGLFFPLVGEVQNNYKDFQRRTDMPPSKLSESVIHVVLIVFYGQRVGLKNSCNISRVKISVNLLTIIFHDLWTTIWIISNFIGLSQHFSNNCQITGISRVQ